MTPTILPPEVIAVMPIGNVRFANGEIWRKLDDTTVEFLAERVTPTEALGIAVEMPALDLIPAPKPTMSELEVALEALLDTEELVPEDQDEEFRLELQRAMEAAVEKRDRVHAFMCSLEDKAARYRKDADRQTKAARTFEAMLERMNRYVMRIIVELGPIGTTKAGKPQYRKLEGNTVTFKVQGCVQSTEVTNEEAIPKKHKSITITLPAETWDRVQDSLDLELLGQLQDEVKRPETTVRLSSIKADIEAGIEVPGARLAGGLCLRRL